MNIKKKPFSHWLLVAGYFGLMSLMLACLSIGGVSTPEPGTIRVHNDVVEILDENGNWVPVGSTATFELVGELESMDPWTVTSTALETNESTQIEDGLQAGDLVRAQGIILADGTWLASSIQAAEEQVDPILILIGMVDSVDPWMVNGITLNVTDQTTIQGDITSGMWVRVEILLLPDGTQETLSITPLETPVQITDCTAIIATVVSVDEDNIQFLGWPVSIPVDESVKIEDGNAQQASTATLSPDQIVLVVICPAEDAKIVIFGNPDEGTPSSGGEMLLVCHKPGKNAHTLSIPASALPAHLGHGDTPGACP